MNSSSTQKTVVIVAPYFPPYGGGLERYAYEIASRLHSEYKWRVVIITSGERYGSDTTEEMSGLAIYRLAYRLKVSNTPFNFSWPKKIHDILKKEKPDLINIHTPVPGIGNMTAVLAGSTPIVVTYHTGTMHKGKFLFDTLVWLYEQGPLRLLLNRANFIACSSDFVRFNFLGKYLYKSATITPAVDTELFKPDPSKKAKDPTILFVAGLNWSEQHKGLQTLIEATKKLQETIPDIRLTVVGDGDMRSEYEARVQKMGLEKAISFTGRLNGEKLAEQYQRAHVFALPSENESFSMAILEAMASELPVIATRVGGIPSLVSDNETGILVPSHDSNTLTKKLFELLTNKESAISFGQSGREKVIQKFNWGARVAYYQEIFNQYVPIKSHTRILETPIRFYPYIGGVENHVYYLSEQLVKLGYDITVICANEPKGQGTDVVNGIKVKRLNYSFKIANTNIALGLPYALLRANFDIAHTHMPTPWTADLTILIAKLKKKSTILTVHNDMDKPSFIGKIVTWIYLHSLFLLTIYLTDKIIIVNPNWKVAFKKTKHIFERVQNKIVTIPNGIDTDLFTPAIKKHEDNTILFVSILDEHHRFKGFNYLLDAMQIIKEKISHVKLVVVGGGKLLDEYKKEAKKLKMENIIEFHGEKTQSELRTYYQNAKVFVLPSMEIEGFGIVLLEAMASGVPVVTTDVAGVALEIQEYQTGIVIKPRDSKALADGVIKILSNNMIQNQMSVHGRNLMLQKYSWQMVGKTFSKVLEEISL